MKISHECQKMLSQSGISTELVSFHSIKPLDETYIKKAFKKKLVICIEEHSLIGGAGSSILEFCNQNLIDTNNFMIFSAPDKFLSKTGIKKKLKKIGLNSKIIVDKIKKRLKKINGNKIGIDFDNTIVNYDNSFYQEGIKRKIFNINTLKKTQKID